MKQLLAQTISEVLNMPVRERNALLCELSVKEHTNTIMPDEIMKLEAIQSVRKANGEIDRVLKEWKENPDLDPRIER